MLPRLESDSIDFLLFWSLYLKTNETQQQGPSKILRIFFVLLSMSPFMNVVGPLDNIP